MQTNKAGNRMPGMRWVTLFAVVAVLVTTAGATDFTGWSKKAKITFTGYSKSETLTNFPALVMLGTNIANFSYVDFSAPASGGDLRFSAADGTTELKYEIDTWTSGTSLVWVQVPTLASSNDYIYAYWGNAGQATPPTYTTNGTAWTAYRGVWHLNEPATNGQTTAVYRDSTTNALNGQQNMNYNLPGAVGNGQYLDGSTAWIDITNKPALSMGQNFAFSGWLRFDDTSVGWNRPISKKTSYNAGDGWELQLHSGSDTQLDAGGSSGTQPSANPMVPSWMSHAWYYITVVYNGSTATFYRDGVLRGPGGTLAAVVDNNANKLVFGNNAAHNEVKWKGMVDEFRIQAGLPSSNWIWATYQNMPTNNLGFQTYGAAQSQNTAAPNITTLPAANVGGTNADMIGNFATNGTSTATVYVFWGPTDGNTNWGTWAHTNNLGSPALGVLTNTVNSLSYGVTYAYRYYATNSSADIWGSAVSFTTMGPPAFSGASASASPIAATLSATLTSTGAAATTVTCWFGPSAGSLSQVDSWPATTQPQTFTHTQNGLTPGTPCYYAFRAQNTTPDTTTWTVWTATNTFTTPATYVWVGGGANNNWSTGPNWDNGVAPVNDGTAKVAISGSTRPTPVVDTNWNVQSLAFVNVGTAFTMSGSNLTLQAGGFSNNNTTAGNTVTISNNIAVATAQTWSTGGNGNGVTALNGNLTGASGSTITSYDNNSNSGVEPEIQLGGSNSGLAADISVWPNSGGILLRKPSAMIGGSINLNAYDQTIYIDGTTGLYTFGIGTGAGQVNFRPGGNNGGGLYLTGGPATWDPGNGGSYTWGSSRNEVNLGGRASSAKNAMLSIGNTNSSLIFNGGDKTFSTSTAGPANGQLTTILDALSDDGTARKLTSSAILLILSRAVDSRSGAASLGGQTIVSGGALSVSAMNQIFNGNLNLSGGAFVLNNLSWSAFTAGRSGGNGTGANQWQLTGGGFAARGTGVTIDINGTSATTFDNNWLLGSTAVDTNGTLYANAPVTISCGTTLSADRTWKFQGANNEGGALGGAAWLVTGPVHEISGKITGGAASRTLTWNGNGTGGGGGGTVRISNSANDYTATNAIMLYGGYAGNLVVLATDDHCFGNPVNPVIFQHSGGGPDALLLFEDQSGTGKTFGRTLSSIEADNSQGNSGIGSYAGLVTYTGTFTRADNSGNGGLIVYAYSNSQITVGSPGQAATFAVNWINKAAMYIKKEGAGTVVLSNLTYSADASCTQVWNLVDGTLATALDPSSTPNALGGQLRSGGSVSWNDIAQLSNMTNTHIWAVRNASQTYTNMVGGGWSGQFTIDVATNLTLRTYTIGALSPQEGNGVSDTPAWDMVKTGAGTWLFWNANLTFGYGRNNNVRVDQGIFDVTGDMGRGGLTLNGGAVLSGAFSPFTGDGNGTQRLRINSGGGKLGISPSAAGDVSRADTITSWDQSQAATVRFAARNNYNLNFNNAAGIPNIAAPTTFLANRDGSGTGVVYIVNKALNVAGTLGGNGTLRLNNSTGLVTVASGGVVSPGDNGVGTLTIQGGLAMQAGSSAAFDLGTSSDLLVVNGPLTLNGTLNVTRGSGFNSGVYTLLNCTTNITGSLTLAPLSGGYKGTVTVNNTVMPRVVQLNVASGGTTLFLQ